MDVDAAHLGVCSLALDMRHFTQRAHEFGRALTGFGPEQLHIVGRGAEARCQDCLLARECIVWLAVERTSVPRKHLLQQRIGALGYVLYVLSARRGQTGSTFRQPASGRFRRG